MDLLTTSQACRRLDCSPMFFFRRIDDGRLCPYSRDGSEWVKGKRRWFRREDIEAFREAPPAPDGRTWLSTEDTAALLGMDRLSVMRLVRQGKVIGRRVLSRTMNGRRPYEVEEQSARAYQEHMRRTPPEEEAEEWMPLEEAAKLLRMTRKGVERRTRMGVLDTAQFGPPEAPARYVRRSQVMEQIKEAPSYCRRTEWYRAPASGDTLAWFGGFFNAEGCIMINRNQRKGHVNWYLTLSLPNSDELALADAERLIGGKSYFRKRQKAHYRDQRSWQAGGDEAMMILKAIRPWLHRKTAQADLAIEFQERIRSKEHGRWSLLTPEEKAWRDEQKEKISRLNRPNVPR
jgi:hypothetical protein